MMASYSVICSLLVLIPLLSSSAVQSFYVAAPNTIRLGQRETVAIAHDEPNPQRVKLFLQDHPLRKNRSSYSEFEVPPEESKIIDIQVNPEDIPDAVFIDTSSRNYVALVVQSPTFNKEIVLPITFKSGYVFVQTDKPIYTPKEKVEIRVITLNEERLPSTEEIKLQIKNPQNVIVSEDVFDRGRGHNKKMFVRHTYSLPPNPLLGEWTISALYGSQFQQKSCVKFQLAEYVLPTFSLKLRATEFIQPDDQDISGNVTATFVYGKKVEGYATFRFGVKDETGNFVYFRRTKSFQLKDGFAEFRVSSNDLKYHSDIGWFPQISGSRFVVEATVTDFASGNKEVMLDQNGLFTQSLYVISFKRCLKDFRPGLPSVIEADITYANGRPASGIKTTISAVADLTNVLEIGNPVSVSDEDGRVSFVIHPEMQHSSVTVTLRTNVTKLGENQATGVYTQQKFVSRNNGYIAISRRSGRILKPTSLFYETISIEPHNISDIYYMVVSRGIILLMKKLPKGNFLSHDVQFRITYDMVPSFRLIVFAHYRDELIADSLKIDVAEECAPKGEVTIEPDFPRSEPGGEGVITIRGSKHTLVGVLAVDEAVYSLRNKDLLTKSKMFKTMASHDLGCGPGGGRSTNIVLGNAGVVLMTSVFTPSPDQLKVPACEEISRRKREILHEMSQNYTGRENDCCRLGMMKHHSGLNCLDRADIVRRFESDDSVRNCSEAFLTCCLNKQKRIDEIFEKTRGVPFLNAFDLGSASAEALRSTRSGHGDDLDFLDPEAEAEFEANLAKRSDFRETWIFADRLIGSKEIEKMHISLPQSITTWVIQAVSVSNEYGMCVADPKKVVAFQNVFLQLNLPYSVVRNEEVEIQAVVFNYGGRILSVEVYMYGVKDICSGAQEGEKGEQKEITVEPQSAKSVSFPIFPLKTGTFNIKVVARSNDGSDAVIKKLNVVPEGYTVEKSIVLKLDPTNQQRRKKRDIETDYYSDSIEETKNLQVTRIKLDVPEESIPGTASCIISAIGCEFGPTVETSLQDPDKLLLLPVGCGEQNMMRMAPTMYTLRYLKVTGKLTEEHEKKGYSFIRTGYQTELTFRQADGSYAAFKSRPPSVWLTAFVMKIFCQAKTLVHIDEDVICSGLKWLVQRRQPNRYFIDHYPVMHTDMTGGVAGIAPMTAFVLIALQECQCDTQNLSVAKAEAMSYLEEQMDHLNHPLPIAIAAYALALSDSALKDDALEKLQSIEIYDDDLNTLHWETGKGTQDIEVTSYGLLTYLQVNDMTKSSAIVNWLNTKRLASGSFPSTQDTVIALQALSEYAIRAPAPAMNFVLNITSSNDRRLQRSLVFQDENALIQQHVEVTEKLHHTANESGGMLFVKTEGYGVGILSVKLKYNIPTAPEKLRKFEIKLKVSERKVKSQRKEQDSIFDSLFWNNDLLRAVGIDDGIQVDESDSAVQHDEDLRRKRSVLQAQNHRAYRIGSVAEFKDVVLRTERESEDPKSTFVLNLQICVKYLGDRATGMAIVDSGIFTGFEAVTEDLEKLVKTAAHYVEKYEKTSRSVIFYLQETPTHDYCFNFGMKRTSIVGNTQRSVVKVYDYYSPEESGTEFYSPHHDSLLHRKICDESTCQCAEDFCPSKNPFETLKRIYRDENEVDMNNKIQNARAKLIRMACENDYVWKGTPVRVTRTGGFLRILFNITSVLKEGNERKVNLLEHIRELLARDNCKSAELEENQLYLIMGKDEIYFDADGNERYRYLLDKSTRIHKCMPRASLMSAERFLQTSFDYLEQFLPTEGCPT